MSQAEIENQPTTFGHPRGLFYLFFAELWERFSFYGMRGLLTLYLVSELFKEMANGKEVAYEIYAAYGSLVYFTPAIGGMIADRLIGHKNSIMLGAFLMCVGHFTMMFETTLIFYMSLGLLIIGNGFFKPNISSLVGGLYPEGDVRRDAGFTIFYLGINIGAFIAPLLCGWLGEKYGWHYGFGAAGFGMAVGMIVFWIGGLRGAYGNQGEQPEEYRNKSYGGLNIRHIVYLLSFLLVPVFAFLVQKNQLVVFGETGLLAFLLNALLVLVLIYIAYVCFTVDRVTRNRLIVVCVLTLFVTVFWAFFEQAGSSLTLFAEEQVNLKFLNAAQTNSINPGYIMFLAIPFSMMWNWLDKRNLNPNTMVKFGLGIIQLGLGFLVFALSAQFMDDAGKVSMIFLMIGYLLITSGELFLSPIGLSKVTELSPAKLVSFMMGVWFLSSSFAHYIAGYIAKLTSGGGGHDGAATDGLAGEEVAGPAFDLGHYAEMITGTVGEGASEGAVNLMNYTGVFAQIAIVSFAIGLFAIVISPIIKRMMHGIK
jgi:POT family proton-dependent oligopeptide transporter